MTGNVGRLLTVHLYVILYGVSTSVHADSVAGVEFECSVVEYPSFIANLPTLQEPHYVLYTADMDDATQQPWCPDCQQADPIIEEVIKESGGTLLKVKVRFSLLAEKVAVCWLLIAKICVHVFPPATGMRVMTRNCIGRR